MAKVSLCILVVAALLGEISASSLCIVNVMVTSFIINPDGTCWDLDTKLDQVRQEFKKCLGFDVDITAVEALHQEFCEINSEFRKKVDHNRHCITGNLVETVYCFYNLNVSSDLENENIHKKSMFQICKSSSVEKSKCLADNVGGPCGAEGLEVFGRMAKVLEPFFTTSCYAARKAAGDDDIEEEIEYAENKDVEGSLARDCEYQAATATSYSPLVWCILVGLLFVLKWW